MPRTYDSEFRRRVVELVRAGKSVTAICAELGLAEATVYRWTPRTSSTEGRGPEGPALSAANSPLPTAGSGNWRLSSSSSGGRGAV